MKEHILEILKNQTNLCTEEGDLNQTKLIDLVKKYDTEIINIFFADEDLKKTFFIKVGNAWVFKVREFVFYMEENKVNNSYTDYKNRIGLSDGKRFLKDTNDVVLNFPFKDCVLEGGQSTDEGLDEYYQWEDTTHKNKLDEQGNKIKQGNKNIKEVDIEGHYQQKQGKRKEIFFNQVLAKDEIDRLKDPKALTNWARYNKDGKSEVGTIKRDENGKICENLIIKGNNYLALNSLKQQFANKVKLIYIDPPYNTGNDSFNYNDSFNHSTWLTFMKNRLEVARDLLSDNGVIFVQCDDNEQAYLKVLMDEVFGREEFLSTIISQSTPNGRDYGGIAKTHEYIHIHQKQKNAIEMNMLLVKDKKFNHKDDTGKYNIHPLYNSNVNFNENNRPNLYYPIYVIQNKKVDTNFYKLSMDKQVNSIEIFPPKSIKDNVQFVWRWGKEKATLNLNKEIVGHKISNGDFRIVQKMRTTKKYARSIWDGKEFSNRRATDDLQKLFNEKVFTTPKPEALLQRIIEIATKKGDLVLDYHLGSGTTCAVAHKMGRQYIGIEQMDYIENIAVKRMQKVIGQPIKKDGELLESLDFDTGGISKSVNWQGGGEFVYCELVKWNETAKDTINACETLEALIKFFDELYKRYFLNYNVKIKEFKEKIILEDNFKNLDLDKQKQLFLTMLDLNQMSVNKSEMADRKYGLSEDDQNLTKDFYGEQ